MKKNIILVICLILFDLITKELFKQNSIKNSGTLFGLFQNTNVIFVIFTVVVMVVILHSYKKEKSLQLGFNFILAGGFGNLVNRLQYGYVIDFIDFGLWPVFNFADLFVVIGIVLIVIKIIRKD